jgi:hypothetical protein
MWFHSGAWYIGVLRARHSLASLLSILDVHLCDGAGLLPESVGIFHRDICGWPLELCKYFCNHLLLQWTATACPMGGYGSFRPGRPAYRSACLVFKSICRCRMSLGIFSASNKMSPRRCSFCDYLCPYDRILRFRYDSVSTSLSGSLSSNVAPASSLIGAPRMVGGRTGICSN